MTFDLEVGVGVACDLGYPCAKFRLPRPFGFPVRADVRYITDRQTDADHCLMPPSPLPGGGIISHCCPIGGHDKPPLPSVCRALARQPSGAVAAHGLQHCWVKPVPDKYAFQAIDKLMNKQTKKDIA